MWIVFILTAILSGCMGKKVQTPATIQTAPPAPVASGKYLLITAEPGMNHNSALSIDIIQAVDEEVWGQLVNMTSDEYFKRRQHILLHDVNIWHIDVLGDFWVEGFKLAGYNAGSGGVMLFAKYNSSNGVTKFRLKNNLDCTRINFGYDSITSASAIMKDLERPRIIDKLQNN